MSLSLIALVSLFASQPVLANAPKRLNVEDYLDSVLANHSGLHSSLEAEQGAMKRSREGSLLLAPTVFAQANYLDDRKETGAAAFQGDRTRATSYALGLSKLTTFGLRATLSYQLTRIDLEGTNPLFVPTPEYAEAKPVLELTQSFWRNGFGRETRAQQDLLEAQALAAASGETFKRRAALIDAELAYWRLQLARETVAIQRDTLARAEKIRAWSERRADLNLADRSDFLQADAAVKLRGLELQAALDEERAATDQFNTLRGVEGAGAGAEALEQIGDVPLPKDLPSRPQGPRADLEAAQLAARAASANSRMGLERVSPVFEAYANLTLNGKDASTGTAVGDSFKANHPTYTVGLKFSAPIDLPATFSARDGHRLDISSAEHGVERKRYEIDRDWKNLSSAYAEARARLDLAEGIEKVQREKLALEKDRQSRGRSTTYQVLAFEQDFASAELLKLRSKVDVMKIRIQSRLFAGNTSGIER